MNGLILALVVSSGGIETTWETSEDGGIVYVVQLDDQTIAALKQGYSITSAIPKDLRGVDSVRLQYGSTPLQKPVLAPEQNSGWPSDQVNPIALASHPAQQGSVSPAEAFRQSQDEGPAISYPDRRRPLAPTVAGGVPPADTTPRLTSGGTFSGGNSPPASSQPLPGPQVPTAEANSDPRLSYDGQSLLSNGQVNPLGRPTATQTYDDTTPIRLPAGHGVLAPEWHSLPSALPQEMAGATRPAETALGLPTFNSSPQGPTPPISSQTQGAVSPTLPPQLAGQAPLDSRQVTPRWSGTPSASTGNNISPPPLLDSRTPQWQNGVRGQNSVPSVTGAPPTSNASYPGTVAQPPRFNGGLQPIPASNQPLNSVGQQPAYDNLAAPASQPLQAPPRPQPPSQPAWWDLVNRQDSQANQNRLERLSNNVSQPVSTSAVNARRDHMTNASSETTIETRDSASQPSKDNRFGLLGLLFLSVGLNAYMAYLLRGFYIKSRQLARDLRESIATA